MIPGTPRDLDQVSRDTILAMLRQGYKIRAIEVYRRSTGAGLREAKEAVEEIERQSGHILGTQSELPNVRPRGAGTGFPFTPVLLAGILIAVVIAVYYVKVAR